METSLCAETSPLFKKKLGLIVGGWREEKESEKGDSKGSSEVLEENQTGVLSWKSRWQSFLFEFESEEKQKAGLSKKLYWQAIFLRKKKSCNEVELMQNIQQQLLGLLLILAKI